MIAGVFVLGTGAGREDLHMRSVLLDTAADAVASAAVATIGAVIYLTGRYFWLDSALSIVISVLVAVGAATLLRDVARALRTGDPFEGTATDPDPPLLPRSWRQHRHGQPGRLIV